MKVNFNDQKKLQEIVIEEAKQVILFLQDRWDTKENENMSSEDIIKLTTTLFIYLVISNAQYFEDLHGFADLVKRSILANSDEEIKFEQWLKQNLN